MGCQRVVAALAAHKIISAVVRIISPAYIAKKSSPISKDGRGWPFSSAVSSGASGRVGSAKLVEELPPSSRAPRPVVTQIDSNKTMNTSHQLLTKVSVAKMACRSIRRMQKTPESPNNGATSIRCLGYCVLFCGSKRLNIRLLRGGFWITPDDLGVFHLRGFFAKRPILRRDRAFAK